MRYLFFTLVLLCQVASAQFSKSIPISTEIAQLYSGNELYLDKMIVSSKSLVLSFYFYNSINFPADPIMLRAVYVDDYKDVTVSGLKVGQIIYISTGEKAKFTITINRPASMLYLKMNISSLGTIKKISFDGLSYAECDVSSEIRKADSEIEEHGRKESLKLINASGLRKLRVEYFYTPSRFPSDFLKDLDSTSGIIEGIPFLLGDSILLSLLNKSRDQYFTQPYSFNSNRMIELNQISGAVVAEYFVKNNTYLSTQLKKAKISFDNNPQVFSSARLDELEEISKTVTGNSFIPKQTKVDTAAIVVLGIILLTLIFIVLVASNRSKSSQHAKQSQEPTSQYPPHEKLGSNVSGQQSGDHSMASNAMMTVETAYTVLGLTPLCTKEEAEEARLELIKKYHPDRISHLGSEFHRIAESKSKEINQAFELVVQHFRKNKS